MIKQLLLLISYGIFPLLMNAQHIPDLSLTYDYACEVKSLDEFRARFNGEESKPGIHNDENSRKANLLNLFDLNMDKDGLTKEQFTNKLNNFIDSVLINDCQFKISDSNLWAECVCRMKYNKQDLMLTLYLQSECYDKNRYRWAIAGVKGLEKAGIIAKDELYPISPVQHEVHFIGLQDMLNENPKQAFGYRKKGTQIDQLSAFLAWVYAGIVEFEIVEKQTFYYFDVPGYIFTINEIIRPGRNRGWLITSLEEASKEEKEIRIKRLIENE